MSKELQDVHGIIYKRKKYKEADLLVKLLSKEAGIISLIVKGALRPKSKLGAATLNFSYGDYVIYTNGHGLSTLRTYKKVSQFEGIYSDLVNNAYASFILDLMDHAFIEYQPIENYYNLANFALNRISEKQDAEILTQIVQMKMLSAFGVQPELNECTVCKRNKGDFDYSIKLGGILCNNHFYQDPSRMHLTPKETAILRTIGLIPIEKLGSINISQKSKKATRKAIDKIYRDTVDLNLKSKKFLDEILMTI